MVYNIYSTVHLPAETMGFDTFNVCSAFPFDNFLAKLKCLIWFMKIPNCSETSVVVRHSKPNNVFSLEEGECFEATEGRDELDESSSSALL